ncbi:hypothetical protein GOP47_0023387 [Adiantum capillus-veneris]|uniref:Uncharacterized protein n=1 Tax=Adiantum capillus-veneris TaxID=13818 RepID=A0A9D4U4F5_ADICA|nr:hypothetical protein GOP47_0023387 [Adiantum capillus-veneris]
MDLKGADIHDFLSCLGRHAITNATFGFHGSRRAERINCDIVFVEDTDELGLAGLSGFHSTHKEEKTEATPAGWGSDSTQNEDNAGWDNPESNKHTNSGWGEVKNEERDEPMPSSPGWGTVSNNEERKETIDPSAGWAEADQESSKPTNSGWGMEIENEEKNDARPSSPGWVTETNNEKTRETIDPSAKWAVSDNPSLDRGRWGDEQVGGDDGGGWDSAGRSKADEAVPASDSRAGWGSEKVDTPVDDWYMTESKVSKTDNDNSKGASKVAFMHPSRRNTDDDLTDTVVDERRSGKFAPSGSNMVPLGKRKCGTKPGFSHNVVPKATMLKDPQVFQDKEGQMGWGMSKQTTGEDKGCWSNTLLQEEGWAHEDVQGKELGGDEWASSTDKGNVSTSWQTDQELTNNGDQKGIWNPPPSGKALAGWGADSNEQGKDIGSAHEGGWGQIEAKQETQPGSVQNGDDWSSQPDRELKSSSSHGWGSMDMQTDNDSAGVQGWNDMQSDAPAVPAINKVRKSVLTSWGSGSREPLKRDTAPRKTFNKGLIGGSWAGFGSNNPQSQSRRPRIRALLNLPEYSELDELYKATNKILHHSDYQPGDKLKPEDEKFILEKIIVHHPDKEAKLGCGVDHVMIDSHGEHQVSCFWVVQKDGSRTDFSYWKCLEQLLETKYPGGMKKESEKEEAKDSWTTGMSSMSPAKVCDQDKAQDCWTKLPSSTACTWDQKEAKDSWKTGVIDIAPKGGISDQGSWGMGVESVAPSKTASSQKGVEVDTPNEILGDVNGAWDAWATSVDTATSMHNQDEAVSSGWEM